MTGVGNGSHFGHAAQLIQPERIFAGRKGREVQVLHSADCIFRRAFIGQRDVMLSVHKIRTGL
jgi:hypothetical protein